MRIAFLVGRDNRETRAPIEAVCALAGVTPCAILLDTQETSLPQRLRKLRRNIRRNGWIYPFYSAIHVLRVFTDRLAERAVLDRTELQNILRQTFPERCFTLEEIGERYGLAVRRVGSLNSPAAIEALRESGADLAIVLGTRILQPAVFSVPHLGSINLHKGKVPDYRGIPPGVWELFDGARVAGVTVHFVDKGVDTGDVVATGEVDIGPLETPESLEEKLHHEGVRILVSAVRRILGGTVVRRKQCATSGRTRTIPTFQEALALRKRLPHWRRAPSLQVIFENLVCLAVFHSGIYRYFGKCRATAIVYRLRDGVSVDVEKLAAQLLVLVSHGGPDVRLEGSSERCDVLRLLDALGIACCTKAEPVLPSDARVIVEAIPAFGRNGIKPPLWLLMEIEGFSRFTERRPDVRGDR